jgi:hypothetical protein
MSKAKALSALALLFLIPALISGVPNAITVIAVNKLPFSRINQTIKLSAIGLKKSEMTAPSPTGQGLCGTATAPVSIHGKAMWITLRKVCSLPSS